MDIQLEIKVIEKFVVKEKQSRYKQFVSSNKTRNKFLRDLPHFKSFKWNLFEEINGNESEIMNRLEKFQGDKTKCYVISENSKIDQKLISLSDAFMEIGGDRATILVFGNADIIYLEGELQKNRFISKI